MGVSAGVRLSAAVMTHPARQDAARALAAQLTGFAPVHVIVDTAAGSGNLDNARRAWAAIGEDATHQLVLQDDVRLCPDFAQQVRRAVTARPGDAVSLFCEWGSRTANLVRLAAWQGWAWARAVDMYTPAQGLILPREQALDFASTPADPEGVDDLALADYLRGAGRRALVTVPNLLEHDDRPSLVGNGFHGLRRSVCAATDHPDVDFDTPVAGDGLVRLPYASWMRAHAEWFYCGEKDRYDWFGEYADLRLPAGLRKADLQPWFAADLAAADPALPAAVAELALFELWTTYFALGLTLPGPARAEPGPYAEPAFATALAGMVRRYLPMPTLEALAPAAGSFARAAFRRGASAGITRPHPEWYVDHT